MPRFKPARRPRLESLEDRRLMAIFPVVNTNDSGDGSLRQEIIGANQYVGPLPIDIQFMIPGTGVHTINLLSPLPAINKPVTINGYTQAGSSPNNAAQGDNAVITIEINGQGAGNGAAVLTLDADGSTIRGLAINRFAAGSGILVRSNNNVIAGNFLGTDPTGTLDRGNGTYGVTIQGGSNNTVGGTAAADRNLISGNDVGGVLVNSGALPGGTLLNDLIQGNLIGTDAGGTNALGNNLGISLQASGIRVGGTAAGAGNVIAFNKSDGVKVGASFTGDVVLTNSIFGNLGDAIDLGAGANGDIPAPVITKAVAGPGAVTTVTGHVHLKANATYRVQYFRSSSAPSPTAGQGQAFIAEFVLPVQGNETDVALPSIASAVPVGQFLTATLTGPDGTSTFSAAAKVAGPSGTTTHRAADFDGDGKTDLSTFDPNTGNWNIRFSGGGPDAHFQYGQRGDVPVAADFDGDGKTDVAVYRPSTAQWFVALSGGGSINGVVWGQPNTDTPVVGDYDGDGKADIGVYRPSTAQWFIALSGGGTITKTLGKANDDLPVPTDFDGDGKADLAVYRPSTAHWYILYSGGGGAQYFIGAYFKDKPIPSDYDGDGKADIAVFRTTTGEWFVLHSNGTPGQHLVLGKVNDDIPLTGDVDGDGKTDIGVYRPSAARWLVIHSGGTPGTDVVFGSPVTDVPVPSALVYRFQGISTRGVSTRSLSDPGAGEVLALAPPPDLDLPTLGLRGTKRR